jgi:hypothetical protein
MIMGFCALQLPPPEWQEFSDHAPIIATFD